ncbi:MAG: translation elongation factor-like protein [Candidatus Tectomicrobia bacterium]|uniref:Translation elongation factor-like protein n=1 Tax=Tectimicrobiota bacterium TaxID=2528274 RepID=A0A932MQT5_UNCTE|nr:translation elongation factor-like protein [Candidatus Tectomicrobia bacterium]
MTEHRIGRITHYYKRLGVAALELEEPLRVGDRVHIAGHTTDLAQPVETLEIDHRRVLKALPGQSAGVKVYGRVRPGDAVLLEEEDGDEEFLW